MCLESAKALQVDTFLAFKCRSAESQFHSILVLFRLTLTLRIVVQHQRRSTVQSRSCVCCD